MEELQWITNSNLRELLKEANSLGIKKDKVVSLIPSLDNYQYILVYYGEE